MNRKVLKHPSNKKMCVWHTHKPNRLNNRNASWPCSCFVVKLTPERWQSGKVAFNVTGTYMAARLHQLVSNSSQLVHPCLKAINLLTTSLQTNSYLTNSQHLFNHPTFPHLSQRSQDLPDISLGSLECCSKIFWQVGYLMKHNHSIKSFNCAKVTFKMLNVTNS